MLIQCSGLSANKAADNSHWRSAEQKAGRLTNPHRRSFIGDPVVLMHDVLRGWRNDLLDESMFTRLPKDVKPKTNPFRAGRPPTPEWIICKVRNFANRNWPLQHAAMPQSPLQLSAVC